jgi:NAD-dependent dihydropyrimidine dehydrogenase PreA subunit
MPKPREPGRPEMPTIVDLTICDGCATCVDVCPTEAITLVGGAAHIDPDECIDCAACIDVCPQGAISEVDVGEAGG